MLKELESTGRNLPTVPFEEDHIPFAESVGQNGVVWQYGVLPYWTPKVAIIASAYYNKLYFNSEEKKANGPTVKLEPYKTNLLPGQSAPNTKQQLYLVRYMLGSLEQDVKTGKEQLTIDYTQPVEILRVFDRRQCVSIEVERDGAVVRMVSNKSSPALDPEKIRRIPYEVLLQGQTVVGNEYGVIRSYNPNVDYCYINSYHADSKTYPNFKSKVRSILFAPHRVTLLPKGTVLDTRTNVYLVKFSVKGSMVNPKTGECFPSVDPNVPVTIVQTFPIKECVLLCPQADGVLFSCKENKAPPPDFSTCVERLQQIIKERLSQSDYVLTSSFPQIARRAGIADFRLYADTVEGFVSQYLPGFKVLKNIVLNDIRLPGVIVPQIFTVQNDSETEEENKANLAELDRLFASGDDADFLSSRSFTSTAFRDLPKEYQQKALTCAARIMHRDHAREITLEPFELALLRAEKGEDFIKKWKIKGVFDNEIFQSYARSSWAQYSLPRDSSRAFEELNDIGRIRTVNDNYTGLTERFAQCGNRLTPYLYLLRIMASPTPKAVRETLSKYCQVVKALRPKLLFSWPDGTKKLFCLEELVLAVRTLLPEIEFPGNLVTNIVSVFVDCNCIERAAKTLAAIDPQHAAVEWKLLELHQNPFAWTEDRLRALLQRENINRQLFQKTVSLIWERYVGKTDLPEPFLRLLAWICVWDDSFSIDEIVRYHFQSEFTKRHKQIQLLRAHARVCALAAGIDLPMYALAAYISNVTAGGLDEAQLPPESAQSLSQMDRLHQQVCASALQNVGLVSPENAQNYEILFRVFRFDFSVTEKIQREYANWYLQKPLRDCSARDLETHLDHLIQSGAYEAYARVYTLYAELYPSEDISPKMVETYIVALIQMRCFSEAIQYLRTRAPVSAKTRELLQIRVLSENFRLNALDEQAFRVLDQSISWEEAHTLLIAHIGDNVAIAVQSVNCLMALYCHSKRYCRVAYLYKIYQPKAENGFTRLYSGIRKLVPQAASGAFKNHYDVIAWAFSALDVEGLVGFFQWVRDVPVPDFKELNHAHGFSFFYGHLIENPLEPKNWQTFLTHLTKRVDLNLWQIVVCETILGTQSTDFSPTNSGLALSHILDNSEPAELPYNLLPYALSYLMQTNGRSTELYEKLTKALSDPDVVQRLVQNNPWHPTYAKTMERFQAYALRLYRETGSPHYSKLLNVLPLALKTRDLLTMSLHDHNMQRALVQLCQNYLDGGKQSESRQFLSDISIKDLIPRERNMLELLKTIFDEDENLLLRYPLLFRDENEVIRFKQDCAFVLVDYPNKAKMRQFEQNCLGIAHKLTVYSFVFRVMYDEDLYHAPQYAIEAVDLTDSRTRYAYLLFLRNVYLSQLDFNAAYDFFYKKWRYLKMLIATVLLNWGDNCDDAFILSTMRQYDHYDSIYHSDYEPFKRDVFMFVNMVPLADESKQTFLLAMMVGQIGWFLQGHAAELAELPAEDKALTAQIIEKLDYREVSGSFFKLYGQELLQGSTELTMPVAQALSPKLVDALEAFRQAVANGKDCTAILRIAQTDPPSACTKAILRLKTDEFTQFANVIAPVVFARQFPFQFYRNIRERLIRNHKNEGYLDQILEKFSLCCRYAAHGDPNAQVVQVYLTCLRWCLLGQRAKAQQALAGQDIWTGIPQSWQDEAQQMLAYTSGQQEHFRPDPFSKDSSQESKRTVRFTFVTELQKHLNIASKMLKKGELDELRVKYHSGTLTPGERLKAGVTLLANTSQNEGRSHAESSPREELLLEVGLEAIRPESGISADVQLTIASELLDATAGRGKAVATKFGQLLENFRKILNRGVSLAGWAQHADSIQKCLGYAGTGNVEDFARLNKHIIQPCGELLGADHTNEERLVEYNKLLGQIKGFDTVKAYAAKVDEAIRDEIEHIESGVRLSICCDEQQAATDGYVYYQLRNVGKKTAQLNTKALRVWFRQDDYLPQELEFTGLNELQSKYVTGGRAKLHLDGQSQNISVEFWIEQAEDGVLLCRAKRQLPVTACRQDFTVDDSHEYAVQCAVNDADMLFGRDDVKDKLRMQLTHAHGKSGGLAVIYGPSRIGKTSLLNWVANDYASEKGNVIRVSFGGEGGRGDDTDYQNSFIPSEYPQIPYEDNQAMSEYLLSCTIRQAFGEEMKSRRCPPEKKSFPPDLMMSLQSILSDNKLRLFERYHNMNELLRDAGLELWLLLDEFQQVVERWKTITKDCDFVQLCLALNYPGSGLTQIKLIICGSDDLLQHMVLEDNSVWRHAFKGSGITVEPLRDGPFSQMIREEHGIAGANIRYSDQALDALFSYTGGVALYGKEICNVILKDIASRPDAYRGRNEIYVRDVAWATQTLLNLQDEELRADAKEGIREIYEAVTKNLNLDTDKQYLWYIAWWLHKNPDKDSFPESEFTQHELVGGETALKNSLTIAVARRILCISDNQNRMGPKSYTFGTIFYYCAFLGGVNLDRLDTDKIFVKETLPSEDETQKNVGSKTDQLRELFDSMDEKEQLFAVGGIVWSAESTEVLKKMRDMAGAKIQNIQNQFQGNVTVNISIQQIGNTINSILATNNPQEVQAGLQALPRLDAYFEPNALSALTEDLNSGDPKREAQAEAEIGAKMDQMSANYRAGIAMQEEVADKNPVWELLGIDHRRYKDLQRDLDPSLMVDLYYAARLEDVFRRGMEHEADRQQNRIDCSPVTIMYCKILEKALKLYHTDIYIKRLPKAWTQVKLNDHIVKFGELSNQIVRKNVQNKIMIGAFLYPINPDYPHKVQYEQVAGNHNRIKYWQQHGTMLLQAKEIRNNSAHGASGVVVTHEDLQRLKKMLIIDEGLLNIVSLAD